MSRVEANLAAFLEFLEDKIANHAIDQGEFVTHELLL